MNPSDSPAGNRLLHAHLRLQIFIAESAITSGFPKIRVKRLRFPTNALSGLKRARNIGDQRGKGFGRCVRLPCHPLIKVLVILAEQGDRRGQVQPRSSSSRRAFGKCLQDQVHLFDPPPHGPHFESRLMRMSRGSAHLGHSISLRSFFLGACSPICERRAGRRATSRSSARMASIPFRAVSSPWSSGALAPPSPSPVRQPHDRHVQHPRQHTTAGWRVARTGRPPMPIRVAFLTPSRRASCACVMPPAFSRAPASRSPKVAISGPNQSSLCIFHLLPALVPACSVIAPHPIERTG